MDERDNWHPTDLLHVERGRGDPFAAAVRSTRMPMAITDPAPPDNPIVIVNEAFKLLTGYSRDECIGKNCRFLQGPNQNAINASAYPTLTLESSVQRTTLPSEQATSVGLLMNEVLLNLFDTYLPLASVKLDCHSAGETITIKVRNRLSSKTPQHELPATSTKLIARLAARLKAQVTWDSSLDGTSVTIRIPVSDKHAET